MNFETQQSESGGSERSPGVSGWWFAVVAAEVGALVALGVMAYSEWFFPFYPPDRLSFDPVTGTDRVGLGILAIDGLVLLTLAISRWWKTGVPAALAVAIAVVVVAFGWGRDDPRLFVHDSTGVALPRILCYDRAPGAAESAFAVGRIPEECRDLYTPAGDSPPSPLTTTTTQPAAESARSDLALALSPQDRDALRMLANAYQAMARSFDNNDQAALIAWHTAYQSGDQELIDEVAEAARETMEPLDGAVLQVVFDARDRLHAQLSDAAEAAIDRYLSLVQLRPSDFDRFLDVVFGLNLVEVNAVLDAVN